MKLTSKITIVLTPFIAMMQMLLGATSAGAVNGGAQAMLTCDTRATIIADLEKGYSEQPIALGVTSVGTVMELWTAANGDTWTLVVTMGNGDSCVVGAGDGWTPLQKSAKGKIL